MRSEPTKFGNSGWIGRRAMGVPVLVLLVLIVLAGCGSSGSDGTGEGESLNEASGSASERQKMTKLGEEWAEEAGKPVEVKPETIGMVEVLHAAEVQRRITNGLKDAARVMGWKVITCDTAGDPTKAATCARNLLTQGVDAMTSMGVDPSTMEVQMKEAKSKGIPWIGLTGTERNTPLFTAQINQSDAGGAIAKTMSTYILERLDEEGAESRREGGFAYSTFPAIYGIGLRDKVVAEELTAAGVKQQDRHVTDLTNEAQDSTEWARSVLAQHPDVGVIYTTLDIDQNEIANTVHAEFGSKQFPERPLVVGLAAGLATMQKIREGTLDADVEVAVEASSWMAIDQLAEYFTRKRPITEDLYEGNATQDYPVWFLKPYMVTKKNVPSDPKKYHEPPYDFISFFNSKWDTEFTNIGG